MHIYNSHVVHCLLCHFRHIKYSFLYELGDGNQVKVLTRKYYACRIFTGIFMASVLSVDIVLCRCYVAILLTFSCRVTHHIVSLDSQ